MIMVDTMAFPGTYAEISVCTGISDYFIKGNNQNWQLGFPEPVTESQYTESKAVMVCDTVINAILT